MTQALLPLPNSPAPRRRGRPPGSGNRRSLDLAKYVEASFGGMTPGQVAAELSMVKPADLKRAKEQALQLKIYTEGLSPLALAMAVKAQLLAQAISCDPKEAWLLMQKEREGLMAYVHQKRAPMAEAKPGQAVATAFVIPEGEAGDQVQMQLDDEDEGGVEILGEISDQADQVAQLKSDADTQEPE